MSQFLGGIGVTPFRVGPLRLPLSMAGGASPTLPDSGSMKLIKKTCQQDVKVLIPAPHWEVSGLGLLSLPQREAFSRQRNGPRRGVRNGGLFQSSGASLPHNCPFLCLYRVISVSFLVSIFYPFCLPTSQSSYLSPFLCVSVL